MLDVEQRAWHRTRLDLGPNPDLVFAEVEAELPDNSVRKVNWSQQCRYWPWGQTQLPAYHGTGFHQAHDVCHLVRFLRPPGLLGVINAHPLTWRLRELA